MNNQIIDQDFEDAFNHEMYNDFCFYNCPKHNCPFPKYLIHFSRNEFYLEYLRNHKPEMDTPDFKTTVDNISKFYNAFETSWEKYQEKEYSYYIQEFHSVKRDYLKTNIPEAERKIVQKTLPDDFYYL